MTLPKKGLRKINHAGITFGWYIRSKPTYCQGAFETPMAIAIEAIDVEKPKILHVELNISRPDNWIEFHQTSITPAIIHSIIIAAKKEGWQHDSGGSPYAFKFAVIKHT